MVNQIRKLLIIKGWERKTTYSDELDLEESDFENSLFPLQCYGNFKKSKKIIGGLNGVPATVLMASFVASQSFHRSVLEASIINFCVPWLSLPPQNQSYV